MVRYWKYGIIKLVTNYYYSSQQDKQNHVNIFCVIESKNNKMKQWDIILENNINKEKKCVLRLTLKNLNIIEKKTVDGEKRNTKQKRDRKGWIEV